MSLEESVALRCSLCAATRNEDGACSFVECKDPLHDNRLEAEARDKFFWNFGVSF